MKSTGVVIARFQTPHLHEGHLQLLNHIRSLHNRVVVVLGVSPVKGSKRNPFDFYTREKMLKQYAADMVILPLSDNRSDKVWSANLDALLAETFPKENFVLYGSRDCFIQSYSGRLAVEELPAEGIHSATALRNASADKTLGTEDFRLGINYAYQNLYAKVYATVDIALLRNNGKQVLLGQKPHTRQWRFPGGFSDPADDSFEAAAMRELQEECGNIQAGAPRYIASLKINDWRYRSEEDKIITTFFCAGYISGTAMAGDDLAAVQWCDVAALHEMINSNQIAEEHHSLVQALLRHLNISNH